MSQTGTPTEFLKLGITEPDDTLNVLVDLNGQWQKIDTGVKNVDTKANTNASGISALNTAVQDNTENITNILETNVNQQTSIDTLQSKVATLEQDDTSYGSRITAVEAGVQENSELINDLEVDLSGVKTSVGTVPEGSNLQGEVNGLDTRVTALENSGSVAAVEARVTTLETEVGTVPAGETVQGQITTLNGQVNSGNIPFRFSVDGEGNYGYLKADDSFVPFRSGDSHWHVLDTSVYMHGDGSYAYSHIVPYNGYNNSSSPNYRKLHDLVHDIDYTLLEGMINIRIVGNLVFSQHNTTYIAKNGAFTPINGTVVGVNYMSNRNTCYITRNQNVFTYNVVDVNGDIIIGPATYNLKGTPSGPLYFDYDTLEYIYNSVLYHVYFKSDGSVNESTPQWASNATFAHYMTDSNILAKYVYVYDSSGTPVTGGFYPSSVSNKVFFSRSSNFVLYAGNKYYYYV